MQDTGIQNLFIKSVEVLLLFRKYLNLYKKSSAVVSSFNFLFNISGSLLFNENVLEGFS